jgi:hypothetical protein
MTRETLNEQTVRINLLFADNSSCYSRVFTDIIVYSHFAASARNDG